MQWVRISRQKKNVRSLNSANRTAGWGNESTDTTGIWVVVDELTIWLLIGISSSSRWVQTGSKRGSNSGASSENHGRTTPLNPLFLAQVMSLIVASTSWKLV